MSAKFKHRIFQNATFGLFFELELFVLFAHILTEGNNISFPGGWLSSKPAGDVPLEWGLTLFKCRFLAAAIQQHNLLLSSPSSTMLVLDVSDQSQ